MIVKHPFHFVSVSGGDRNVRAVPRAMEKIGATIVSLTVASELNGHHAIDLRWRPDAHRFAVTVRSGSRNRQLAGQSPFT